MFFTTNINLLFISSHWEQDSIIFKKLQLHNLQLYVNRNPRCILYPNALSVKMSKAFGDETVFICIWVKIAGFLQKTCYSLRLQIEDACLTLFYYSQMQVLCQEGRTWVNLKLAWSRFVRFVLWPYRNYSKIGIYVEDKILIWTHLCQML